MKSNQTTKETLTAAGKSLESAAQDLLKYATKKGADRTKISASATMEWRLMIENKELVLANTLETQKFGILVHKDQKKGSATLNNTNPDSLKRSVDDAMTLANFSVADPILTMPDSSEATPAKTLPFMFDDQLAERNLNDLQEFAQTVLARLVRDKRVALDKCEFSISATWHGLYNSLGMKQSEMQTALGWSYFGMAVDGDEVSGFDYDGRHTYRWQGGLDLALEDADKFCEKVVSNLRPGKAPSYKGQVLLSPRAVEEILLGTILYHASGSSVMDGKSKWSESVGKKVVSPLLTITDHPHDERFTGATAFDGDGLPTRDHTLIKNGILGMHLHDCYSAKKTGTKSNACSGAPFAMVVAPGSGELKAMRSARPELLLVDRFSGNIDPVKGDFSGVAKSSRLISNGQDAGPVSETMIAGNLFEVLEQIVSISSVQELVSGAMLLPWMLVDNISISSG